MYGLIYRSRISIKFIPTISLGLNSIRSLELLVESLHSFIMSSVRALVRLINTNLGMKLENKFIYSIKKDLF